MDPVSFLCFPLSLLFFFFTKEGKSYVSC